MSKSIVYSAGYKYQLKADAEFYADFLKPYEASQPFIKLKNGKLAIGAGYAWDGCSGPTIDTDSTMRPSLFHDVCCQLMRQGLLPHSELDNVNKHFHKLLLQDGTCKPRALGYYIAVEKFGEDATLPSNRKRVYYAP